MNNIEAIAQAIVQELNKNKPTITKEMGGIKLIFPDGTTQALPGQAQQSYRSVGNRR